MLTIEETGRRAKALASARGIVVSTPEQAYALCIEVRRAANPNRWRLKNFQETK